MSQLVYVSAEDPSTRKSLAVSVMRKVAEKLGNTVAVCKSSYIHPVMLELALQEKIDLDKLFQRASTKYSLIKEDLNRHELTALYLIEKDVPLALGSPR